MHMDWQNAIVGLIVAGAAVYLSFGLWHSLVRRRSACGACSTCPAAKSEEPLVVGLDPEVKPAGPRTSPR